MRPAGARQRASQAPGRVRIASRKAAAYDMLSNGAVNRSTARPGVSHRALIAGSALVA